MCNMTNTTTVRTRKKQHDLVENVKRWLATLLIDRRLFMLGNVKALKVAKASIFKCGVAKSMAVMTLAILYIFL